MNKPSIIIAKAKVAQVRGTHVEKPAVFGKVRRSFPTVRRILVPLDFSGKSRQALPFVIPIALAMNAKIILLHVMNSVEAAPEYGFATGSHSQRKTAAVARLNETAAKTMPLTLLDQVVVKSGKPAETIAAVASSLRADLIAVTTHGRSGIKRVLVGSTAERLLRTAPCPVLVVRRK